MEQCFATIISHTEVMPGIYLIWLESPGIAALAKPGQFVIIRIDENGERIPLTIADADPHAGTIELSSELGLGTSVEIWIPVNREDAMGATTQLQTASVLDQRILEPRDS